MKAEWVQIKRGDVLPWLAGLHVTLNGKGEIVFNRSTWNRLGSPDAVHILYDKTNNRIGLKPTRLAIDDAYPIQKNNRHGSRKVRAYRLLAEYAIDLPETVQFPTARIDEDGILILDLRTARVSERYLARMNREHNRSEQ